MALRAGIPEAIGYADKTFGPESTPDYKGHVDFPGLVPMLGPGSDRIYVAIWLQPPLWRMHSSTTWYGVEGIKVIGNDIMSADGYMTMKGVPGSGVAFWSL